MEFKLPIIIKLMFDVGAPGPRGLPGIDGPEGKRGRKGHLINYFYLEL